MVLAHFANFNMWYKSSTINCKECHGKVGILQYDPMIDSAVTFVFKLTSLLKQKTSLNQNSNQTKIQKK